MKFKILNEILLNHSERKFYRFYFFIIFKIIICKISLFLKLIISVLVESNFKTIDRSLSIYSITLHKRIINIDVNK